VRRITGAPLGPWGFSPLVVWRRSIEKNATKKKRKAIYPPWMPYPLGRHPAPEEDTVMPQKTIQNVMPSRGQCRRRRSTITGSSFCAQWIEMLSSDKRKIEVECVWRELHHFGADTKLIVDRGVLLNNRWRSLSNSITGRYTGVIGIRLDCVSGWFTLAGDRLMDEPIARSQL
jgi:hypothetical protein